MAFWPPCFRKNDPGFVHNGALAGLVAVCAVLISCIRAVPWSRAIAGGLFVKMFVYCQEKLQIDDVLGLALHGLAVHGAVLLAAFSAWRPGRPRWRQPDFANHWHARRLRFRCHCWRYCYGARSKLGIRLSEEEEQQGADLSSTKSPPIQKLASVSFSQANIRVAPL